MKTWSKCTGHGPQGQGDSKSLDPVEPRDCGSPVLQREGGTPATPGTVIDGIDGIDGIGSAKEPLR